MFRYTIVALGRMKNQSLANLTADYLKRLGRHGQCRVIELKDGTPDQEEKRLNDYLNRMKEDRLIVLGEEGQTLSSRKFASQLEDPHGRPLTFVVGGAYGIAASVKRRADLVLSLSPFTFTHETARMLLTEQLYRAVSIRLKTGYHHD